jgi:DinB superfamily
LDASQPEPRTAADLIDRVQTEWAALEYLVAGLSLPQLITPGPQGWSVKDHLVHIAEWEAATGAVLARRPQHEGFRLAPPLPADIDALNDLLFQRSRDVPIDEVQANGRRVHAEIIAALGRLTDADVRSTIAEYGANPTDDRPLLQKMAGDTYLHYAEHVGWIKELLAARGISKGAAGPL